MKILRIKCDWDKFTPVNSNDKYAPSCYRVIVAFIFIDENLPYTNTKKLLWFPHG